MYSFPKSWTLAALTIASAASTAPTKPLVSTIPSASRGMSRLLALLLIVKVKNDFSLVARTRQRSTPRGKNQGTHQRARKNLSLTRSRGASYIAPKVAARGTLPAEIGGAGE